MSQARTGKYGDYMVYQIDPKELDRIRESFTYHPPFDDQPERYREMRSMALDLALTMTRLCPASRELSLALTNLQQAVMWANAAIAVNEIDSAEDLTRPK